MLIVNQTIFPNPATSVTQAETPATAVSERRMRWLEVVVVMSVAFLTPLLGSIHALIVKRTTPAIVSQYGFILGSFMLLPPLLTLMYVLWRNGRTFRDIGLRWSWKDVGVGVLLAIVALFTTGVGGLLLRLALTAAGMGEAVHASVDTIRHTWTRSMLLMPGGAAYMTIVPFYEEILVRAYLMTELIDLTGSTALAVAVSTLLQASYHLYYGWIGAAAIVFTFLPWALFFAAKRRALPCVTAHWLYDLIALLAKR